MSAEYYVTLTQGLYIRFQADKNVKIRLIFYCMIYNGIGLSKYNNTVQMIYIFFPFKLNETKIFDVIRNVRILSATYSLFLMKMSHIFSCTE